MKKNLVVLDFDHTIIDANSDLYIVKLAPGNELPSSIKERYSPDRWTPFMRCVFRYLYDCHIQPDDILRCLREIKLVEGIKDMLVALNEAGGYEVIIISDSNSVFIEHILQNAGVRNLVHEIFTNYAHFDSNGCLQISEYHIQDWCNLSAVNLCKGTIMEEYIERRKKQGVEFETISYIGDGSNDYCPCVKLQKKDRVFPRACFSLAKKIGKCPESINAGVFPWKSGFDIVSVLQKKDEDLTEGVS